MWLISVCAACGGGNDEAAIPVDGSSSGDATPGGDAASGAVDAVLGTADANPAGPCHGAAVCEDFESTAVGSVPGAPWTVSRPSCSGTGTLAVVSTQAHSGTRALEVRGGSTFCDHVFLASAAPATLGSTLYARFFVRFAAAFTDAHTTFLALADATDGKDLRMGGQKGIFMWNRELGDATLPALGPAGIALSVAPAANTWYCVEATIDAAGRSLHTSIDGVARSGLVIDATPTPEIDEPWLRSAWSPRLQDIRFGWEAYGNSPMTLWFDDVAVGPSPIGCN